MRNCIFFILLLIPLTALAQSDGVPQVIAQGQKVLIQKIEILGFVLDDKNQFTKIFKPYRNKHLSAADIDMILQGLQKIYEQAGYQGLISIEYHVNRKILTFTVSLVK